MVIVVMKVMAVLAFLIITFSSHFSDAHRFKYATSFLTSPTTSSKSKSSSSEGCCDYCISTRTITPQCQCLNVGEECHSACDKCLCTRSNPPQCHCSDITDFCDESCSPYI
ncbi:hypothetical protein K1719_030272 [Acacia pycnantha]|nr:hypothetical protein K1719_030272 [Acacia pycnantha]